MEPVCFFFLIVFVFNFGPSCVVGQVYPPSYEKTVIPNSTVRLNWTFSGDPSQATLAWYFTRRRVGSKEEIALRYHDYPATIENSSLPGVAFEPPATLVLKNVDKRYNGKYCLSVQVADAGGNGAVELYIAEKPNVTINCSSIIKLNERDNFTCLCRGEGGNPPADVTWFRNGIRFGETKTESNTLTRPNVDETDNATYTCLAQSFPKHAMFNDSKSVVVQVKFEPKDTSIEFTQSPAKLGKSVTIRCKSLGFPEPRYTIILNGSTTVSTEKTYTIPMVGWNDTGRYNCTANNERGSDWAADFLDVTEQGPTTAAATTAAATTAAATTAAATAASTPKKNSSSTTSSTKKGTTKDDGGGTGGLSTGAIIGIVIVGLLVLLVIIGIVVYCCKSKDEDGRNRQNHTEMTQTDRVIDRGDAENEEGGQEEERDDVNNGNQLHEVKTYTPDDGEKKD